MKMTGHQLRAARALIGLEQAELAERSGLNINTIRKMEHSGSAVVRVRLSTLHRIMDALRVAGVIFIEENGDGPGVRLRKGSG